MVFVDTPTHRQLRNQVGGAGTLLYDAVVSASTNNMMSRRGRKALVLLTDGVDTGSEASLEKAIEAALKADTLVYSIYFSDTGFYGGILGGENGRIDPSADVERDGRRLFRGLEEAIPGQHLCGDCRGTAEPVQHRLRSDKPVGYRSSAKFIWVPRRRGSWYRRASDTGRADEIAFVRRALADRFLDECDNFRLFGRGQIL